MYEHQKVLKKKAAEDKKKKKAPKGNIRIHIHMYTYEIPLHRAHVLR